MRLSSPPLKIEFVDSSKHEWDAIMTSMGVWWLSLLTSPFLLLSFTASFFFIAFFSQLIIIRLAPISAFAKRPRSARFSGARWASLAERAPN